MEETLTVGVLGRVRSSFEMFVVSLRIQSTSVLTCIVFSILKLIDLKLDDVDQRDTNFGLTF